MQIIALRGLQGDYGSVRRGQVVDVDERKAKQLIGRGLAAPRGASAGISNETTEVADTASARPRPGSGLKLFPGGGRTGKAKRSSSSPADRVSAMSTSTVSEGVRE